MTMDLQYIEDGYIDDHYFTYIAEAESNQVVNSNLSALGGILKDATVNLVSTFELVCRSPMIQNASLFAVSEATMAIEVSRVRDINVEASSAFNLAVDGTRSRYISAQCDSDFTTSLDYTRLRDSEAAIDAAFSSSITPTMTKGVIANLDLTTTMSVSSTLIKSTVIDMQANATISKFYGTYSNKRPRTANPVGIVSPYGLVTSNYKFGTGSFYSPEAVNIGKSLRIQTSGIDIGTGDFLVSVWVDHTGTTTSIADFIEILTCDDFTIGYRIGPTGAFPYVIIHGFTYVMTTQLTSGWDQLIFKRVSATLSLTLVPNGVSGSAVTLTISNSSTSAITMGLELVVGPNNSTYDVPLWIDELFMTLTPNTADVTGVITDGADDGTQFLYHFNEDYVDDMIGVHEFNSVMTSTASLNASATNLLDINAFLIGDTRLTCTFDILPTEYNANLIAEFTQVTNNTRTRDYNANLSSAFGLNIEINRVRNNETHFDAIATELVATAKIGNFLVTLESNLTLNSNPVKIAGLIQSLDTTSELSTIVSKTVGYDASINSTSTLTASIMKVMPFSSTMDSQFTLNETTMKLVGVTSNQNVTTSLTVSASVLGANESSMHANATLTAVPNITKSTIINVTATATETVTIKRTRSTSITVNSMASLVTNNTRRRETNVALLAFATTLAAVGRKVNEVASLNVVSMIIIQPTVILGRFRVEMTATASMNIVGTRIRSNVIVSQSTTNLTVYINKFVGTITTLQSNSSLIAVGSKFFLDPDLIFIVQREDRGFIIEPESRDFIIQYEDRTEIIGN